MSATPASILPSHAHQGPTLIIGATGFMGHFITQASLASRRLTYILVRSNSSCPTKANMIKLLQDKGAIVVYGSINDQDLVQTILRDNQIEVVISVVGGERILDQLNLLRAIKAAGNVKRFLPSEFGHDVDRADPVEPGLTMYKEKRKVRRMTEEFGIPYTYICCNSIASWPYDDNIHPSRALPPMDQFQIYGDGSVKAYFVEGSDIGNVTVRIVDDIRTVNKSVHFRPPNNYLNMNELASLWENKIKRTLPRVTVTEDTLLDAAKENCIPQSIVASFTHDIFIKGCQSNFSVDGPNDVEASTLYPDIPFKSMSECFDKFFLRVPDQPKDDVVEIVDKLENDVINMLKMAICA